VTAVPVKGTFKGAAQQHLTVFVSVDYEDGQTAEELNEVDANFGQQSTANPPSLRFGGQGGQRSTVNDQQQQDQNFAIGTIILLIQSVRVRLRDYSSLA